MSVLPKDIDGVFETVMVASFVICSGIIGLDMAIPNIGFVVVGETLSINAFGVNDCIWAPHLDPCAVQN